MSDSLVRAFPPFALTVTAGSLTMRYPRDEDIAELAEVAVAGIHPRDRMPFYFPWTEPEGDDLRREMARYYWRHRADDSPKKWALLLAVRVDGEMVGMQSWETESYLVTRTGETGSWLGERFQGRGIGTRMRRAICALAFDHLDAVEVTSGAFLDNPQSLAVSRKVGYVPDGIQRLERRPGELAFNQRLVLRPEAFVRGDVEIEVEGIEPFRRFIGLDEP
ncbi:GCN5-related N-acetyltransferase [Nostocoides japonicum T1-X7]|uniref:GCN5-related N-acetyltransferase n=1 Tax=Nostocoides japonicum T1-X7 TaxID=1194083 RepID=A0A077LYH0_9MICO|nr:GNAT family protein [Tetrasphaera japonica]CCH78968.1 GCN5-related N-acetyltransferase [Tetrasphaera japonica T1-X7]